MRNIFVDTDIILDLLAAREPFYKHAAKLFAMADTGKIKISVSALTFSNLHYILRKAANRDKAVRSLQKLKLLVKILPVNETIIELALTSEFRDFEDAIQFYVAKEEGIEYLLTRNTKDYKRADITIMTAEEFEDFFSEIQFS